MDVSRTIQPQVPAGTSLVYRGGVVPFGYLLEDGSLHEPGAYPRLFEAIGYTYGQVGTKFRLPKSFGTVDIGAGQGDGLTNRVLGQLVGSETHVLTEPEMPNHTHIQNPHNHGQNPHSHALLSSLNSSSSDAGPLDQTASPVSGGVAATLHVYSSTISAGKYVTNPAHPNMAASKFVQDTIGTNIQNTATNQNAGGGGAHNNMQPSLVATKMIKF